MKSLLQHGENPAHAFDGRGGSYDSGRTAEGGRTVEIVDCTLRDGEQTPGVEFSVEQKVRLAGLLGDAGVTTLDAGFPAASGADMEAIQGMRAAGVRCGLGATARPLSRDIEAAHRSGADEAFVFMPTSDLRIRETLGMERERAEQMMVDAAAMVVSYGMTVSIVFEDATRADPSWLELLVERVLDRHPVRRVVVADTVGCGDPESVGALFARLHRRIPKEVSLATHCHNDLGLATANTLAAVRAGASTVSCTVNGIGERAGNADLAECTAALTHLYGIGHGVDPMALPALSEQIERASGVHVSPLKPVTGSNVYRHESGVHVDALLKDQRSYEFLPPAWTGRQHELVLGKHSGAALVRHLLDRAGQPADDDTVFQLLSLVKSRLSERDHAELAAGYRAKVDFERTALSGVPPEALLSALSGAR